MAVPIERPEGALLAVRCHDITLSLAGRDSGDFEELLILGMAVRLALHLRGVQAVGYEVLRQIALHLLHIPATSLRRVLETLAEAEFIRLDQEGKTIKAVVPTVPYYDDLFEGVGEIAKARQLSEAESLTLALIERLSQAPTAKETFYNIGAERKLVNRVIGVGNEGGYIIGRRARGRDMLVSPLYFQEHADAFADIAAGAGSGNVATVITALSRNQGWPLAIAKGSSRIGETTLTQAQLKIVLALAGEGFAPPPAIRTSYAGENFFLFSPKPGLRPLTPAKKTVYEAAMAIVAAVRQGQLLPRRFAIRWPVTLLTRLRDRKFLRANTEALEQYQKLVVLRLGRLVNIGGQWARFELIETVENLEAVEMAIALMKGEGAAPQPDEDVVLAFQKGDLYVESVLGRQKLKEQERVELDPETQDEIDNLFYRGSA